MLFDDYSTENCEDDQDMFPSNDIFNDDILWSLHYFPSSENLIPFQDIFPSYLDGPFENSNNNENASPRVDITEEVRKEKMKVINSEESSMETQQQLIPRKLIRSVSSSSLKKKKNKDRHSKIDTAQGLRDRRMRLSREVARQFFDVQDMLGVDKASKAIQWLLLQSSSAIKALSNSASTSSTAGMITRGSSTSTTDQSLEKKKKMQEQRVQKDDAFAVRELREKARARAKQRTREKIDAQTLKPPDHGQTSYETTVRLIK